MTVEELLCNLFNTRTGKCKTITEVVQKALLGTVRDKHKRTNITEVSRGDRQMADAIRQLEKTLGIERTVLTFGNVDWDSYKNFDFKDLNGGHDTIVEVEEAVAAPEPVREEPKKQKKKNIKYPNINEIGCTTLKEAGDELMRKSTALQELINKEDFVTGKVAKAYNELVDYVNILPKGVILGQNTLEKWLKQVIKVLKAMDCSWEDI